MIMKCKPTFQFQSVEFDFYISTECGPVTEQDLEEMFALYDKILKGLQKIAPIQDQKNQQPAEPLATQSQKDIMDRFHIKYTPRTTKKEAQALINKNMLQDD